MLPLRLFSVNTPSPLESSVPTSLARVHVCTRVCVCTLVCVWVRVSMHARACARMRVHSCVCAYVFSYIQKMDEVWARSQGARAGVWRRGVS